VENVVLGKRGEQFSELDELTAFERLETSLAKVPDVLATTAIVCST